MIVIAHLSDIHIDDGQRSADRARAVMDHLEGLPWDLDAVVVTGDIADHGLAGEYELARRILTSRHPVLTCPGNHDERAAFRRVLLGRPAEAGRTAAETGRTETEAEPAAEAPGTTATGEPGAADAVDEVAAPVNQVHRGNGFVLALCDSSVPGKDHGHLEEETLAWLADVLDGTPDTVPVLVGFHHPPVPLAIPYVDEIRQFGERRLAELADRHPNLLAFLSGHAHTPAATTFAGRPLLVAPGVVSTLRLPWDHRAHADDHADLTHPPALAFHVLDDEGRLTTHYRWVPGA
ncbi:metallophosphoesterase [Streptosporangium sp. NPDC048047]|uniref:metallophosphoesterase n=1 Tax=Streptosporangium sp. NPDC048047 TaxID=3155748 RepID=UPI003430AB2E